jgi:hypothetical protein
MVDFRPVAYVIGRILIVLAILMLALPSSTGARAWRTAMRSSHRRH